jgi:hypothetical protein
MADWRWVTVVKTTSLGGVTHADKGQGQWINLDSVDIIRPLEGAKFHGANSLLIGMDPINRMLVVEKIDPQSRASNNQQQPTGEE